MKISRREMIALMGMTAASGLMGGELVGAAPQASSPAPRLPLDEFVQTDSLVAALRRGVSEMKKRPPSDPLSWVFQAAIHGITPDRVKLEAEKDPKVTEELVKKYWFQCPHRDQNSANFLPWHRGYTYYFERIFRLHTGDDSFSLPYWNYHDPRNRKFPKVFGVEHLDGNQANNNPENINPLFMAQRDFFFTSWEHPVVTEGYQPLFGLDDYAVNIDLPMATTVFFGEIEREGLGGGIADEDRRTRGLLEMYPHDNIHRAVGGSVATTKIDPEDGSFITVDGAMAVPATAGFDPIFPIHHTNIDRLWAEWSCMPGKDWGKRPDNAWFNERPWFFFDADGSEVNEPRKKYFDHRALGVRFKYEDMSCTPLQLPASVMADETPTTPLVANKAHKSHTPTRSRQLLASSATPFGALSAKRSVVPVEQAARLRLKTSAAPFKSRLRGSNLLTVAPNERRIFVRLLDIDLSSLHGAGFDVHMTNNPQATLSRDSASFVGSITLFNDPPAHHENHPPAGRRARAAQRSRIGEGHSQTFDVTKAVASVGSDDLAGLSVVLVPYSLFASANREVVFLGTNGIKVGGIEFFTR